MAKIRDGIFGGFSGKLGNLVGMYLNGKHYLRTVPSYINNPRTKKQQANRKAFGMVSKLVARLVPFIEVTLSAVEGKQPRGAFVSYNMRSAVKYDTEGEVEIDYTNLVVSAGLLKQPEGPSAERTDDGSVIVRWTDNSRDGNARPNDKALLLALHEGRIAGYNLEGSPRKAGEAVLPIAPAYKDAPVHVYLCMSSARGTLFSNSVCLGLVE